MFIGKQVEDYIERVIKLAGIKNKVRGTDGSLRLYRFVENFVDKHCTNFKTLNFLIIFLMNH